MDPLIIQESTIAAIVILHGAAMSVQVKCRMVTADRLGIEQELAVRGPANPYLSLGKRVRTTRIHPVNRQQVRHDGT
jgi:hypothetical protein